MGGMGPGDRRPAELIRAAHAGTHWGNSLLFATVNISTVTTLFAGRRKPSHDGRLVEACRQIWVDSSGSVA